MVRLFQVLSIVLFISLGYGWSYTTSNERPYPLTFIHTSLHSDTDETSFMKQIQEMMENMHQRLQHAFRWPLYYWPPLQGPGQFESEEDHGEEQFEDDQDLASSNHHEAVTADQDTEVTTTIITTTTTDLISVDDQIKKQFESIESVCTTVFDTPTTISPRKTRRRKPTTTQTKTCVKEFVLNNEKHVLQEVTVTDEKGFVIKQTKTHSTLPVETTDKQSAIETSNS